nr:immunoglobulin light chain junction region [Macaca mulatta]MOV36948.1 immunoglobulin light chain junction region [Macaca mulatta]MOV36958.1 immunoglobulin light chain junction region [Macaca mulatta]MOV36962.1 immunoglobulin light chain junction region [Macaca mulatta]MOV36971.1 immunoglobulin light chain junction region [Macaca mulatta]
CLQYDNEPLTF